MDCKQFRAVIDCYIDGELAPDAAGAADAHQRECAACERATRRLLRLRQELRHSVLQDVPPPHLERHVQIALRAARPWPWRWSAAAAVLFLASASALLLAITTTPRLARTTAAALDRVAVRLDEGAAGEVVGQVLCRDCELEHRYGVKASCKVIGHHGAVATSDGRIWNIIEQPASAELIHDNALLGRSVQARVRFFRRAGAIEVETYRLDPRADIAARITGLLPADR